MRLVRAGPYFGAFGLLSTSISGVTASAATLSATSSIDATGSWLVVPRNATPPSAAQVIAGVNYGTVTKAANGSGAMAAKTATTFAISPLAVGTAYDLYVVANEGGYQTTSNVVGPIQFSTVAISTSSVVVDPTTPATLFAALDGSGVYATVPRNPDRPTGWTVIAKLGRTLARMISGVRSPAHTV